MGMYECAVHRPVLTACVPACEGPLCESLSLFLFGQGDAVSEVERKGNIVNRAGLGHHPSVSWKTLMRLFLGRRRKWL